MRSSSVTTPEEPAQVLKRSRVRHFISKCGAWLKRHPRLLWVYTALVWAHSALLRFPTRLKRRLFRILVDARVFPYRAGVNTIPRQEKIVCSLTSYSRRVALVHYAVASLLMQRCKPDKVVLWLDRDNWNEENIPAALRRLVGYGLTVRFCEDLKSYKKLLPHLNEDQESAIVTADDDMYYPREWLKGLYEAYLRNPHCVFCHLAHGVRLSQAGEVLPYRQWDQDTYDERPSHAVMPVGCMGVLYPPGALHDEVQDWEMIQRICPKLDDIWFWTMSVRKDTLKAIVRRPGLFGRRQRPNIFELYDTHSDKLANWNVLEGGNDIGMRAVVKHFGLTETLCKEEERLR